MKVIRLLLWSYVPRLKIIGWIGRTTHNFNFDQLASWAQSLKSFQVLKKKNFITANCKRRLHFRRFFLNILRKYYTFSVSKMIPRRFSLDLFNSIQLIFTIAFSAARGCDNKKLLSFSPVNASLSVKSW